MEEQTPDVDKKKVIDLALGQEISSPRSSEVKPRPRALFQASESGSGDRQVNWEFSLVHYCNGP